MCDVSFCRSWLFGEALPVIFLTGVAQHISNLEHNGTQGAMKATWHHMPCVLFPLAVGFGELQLSSELWTVVQRQMPGALAT